MRGIMKKFIRQILLGIGAYIGFYALLVGMIWLMMLEPPSIMHALITFGIMTAFLGGLFGGICLLAAIMFGIFCLIRKISPIDRINEIDEEEKAKDFLEAKTIEWKREFRNLQEESWNNYVKEKMKELDNASPTGSSLG